MRYKAIQIEERDAAVERLREFLRFNYMTGSQVARQIGVRDTTLYSWLLGHSRPKSAERIIAFLDSMPAERSSIMPTGYEYREYRELARHSETAALSFPQTSKGRDSKDSRRL